MTGLEPHPIYPEPSPEYLAALEAKHGREEAQRRLAVLIDERRKLMENERDDPFRYGYESPIWKKADEQLARLRAKFPIGVITELDLGGNRAGKTERRAKRMVENMVKNPGYRCWALQSTEVSSRQNQQSIIWKYLPREWKPSTGKMRHGTTTRINYSQAGGFTENVLVLPNGSECRFKFYSMDVGSVEGAELDEAWADELVTPDWIEALIFRLVTRNGLLAITFTPIEGYTSTVKQYLAGAVTLEETEAELLPLLGMGAADADTRNRAPARAPARSEGESSASTSASTSATAGDLTITGYEKVPRIQENIAQRAVIVYFHTADNPFGNYESMKQTLQGASREKILTRAYGVPVKASMTQFPLFRDTVHVIPVARFRQVLEQGGTWYQFVDPCSGRNWFFIYVFIDVRGRKFVAGEWPSYGPAAMNPSAYIPGIGAMEPWSVPGKAADGMKGGGQAELGWGLKRYLEEMERVEAGLARVFYGPNQRKENTNDARSKTGSDHDHYSAVRDRSSSRIDSGSVEKIDIFERWMDARYGNARTVASESSTTLIEEMDDLGATFMAAPTERSINSGRGGGDGSIRLINDALYYDASKPLDTLNQPNLYFVENCPNTIHAVKEWTGQDGQHGATKDPIDTLRMMELSNVDHVGEDAFRWKGAAVA